MATVAIPSDDVVWINNDLYCKTPEALEVALATLREIGYEVQDNRVDGHSIRQNATTPEKMEQNGWSLWFAHLDIRQGKCGSCHEYISTHGIRSHGHRCEKCGEVTYLDMQKDSTIRFDFVGTPYRVLSPQLNMTVVHWDSDNGWLYLDPEPLDYGGLSVVHGEKAAAYMAEYANMWKMTEYDGQPAIKVRYFRHGEHRDEDVINAYDMFGHYWNHKIVNVWEGVEYGEYGFDLPIPQSVNIYETWHWAPLEPSPTLHGRLISAVGQVSRADYYYQDGRPAWDHRHYAKMGVFIRHFTTLDADLWDQVSTRFPLDGPGGIAAVAAFCHPDAVVRNEPNIGNFLTSFTGMDRSVAGRKAAVDALQNDPDTQDLMTNLFGRRSKRRQ